MPLYDYHCETCGKDLEILMNGNAEPPKLISAHSSLSGTLSTRVPGAGDTGCCGSQPHQADCQGPGSCCGKNH